MLDVKTTRPQYDSPLRYPGGKSSLSAFLGEAIAKAEIEGVTYVEPFAGGAGAAITLLLQDRVERVVINDLDPAVYSFWRAVVDEGPRFTATLQAVPLTLNEWRAQKQTYASGRAAGGYSFELGFAFFYLNRTNRSGVLNAGVIGGQQQSGRYKIDARFNREKLTSRIDSISKLRERITVSSRDGRAVIEEYASLPEVFLYVDPPYVQMGGSLYLNSFTEADHTFLAMCLNRNSSANWVLTYDDTQLIRDLYDERYQETFSLIYSARNMGVATELMVLSDRMRDSMIAKSL
ncbi:hypothetical protein LK09_14400 [Microbacterium mangrovi]|uniref:site-specific DNA-methyltransferase (adenine-specific) n=1 Tax=Microbacterium mangrovi TaxID=1348253 RepID=A0A0B2A0U9_9MICO|nr:DNA adenine methylase [Microbacterium mangrovi]KHK96646.1 hypothetical protein LK09_14400 [Microbacterium mangrovi]